MSSRGSSSGSTEGRSTKILAGSGLEKGKVDGTKLDEHANSGVEVANLVGNQGNANSGSEVAKLVGNHENANSGAEVTKLVGNFDVCYPAVEKEYLVGRKVDPRDAQDDVSTLGIHFQNSHFLGFRLN